MHSGAAMRHKTNAKQETCPTDEHDSFHDKRRLLSYWKSLDTCPVNEASENVELKNELLVELKDCLSELDDLDSLSDSSASEQEAMQVLQNEQLSLLKQLGEYSLYFTRENTQLDLNDNLKNSRNDDEVLGALKAEITLLSGKNEHLLQQMAKQNEEYKSSSREQQRDIEKLTREVQNFNISRRKLERELLQVTKQKNENEITINSLREEMKTMKDSYEEEMRKLSNMNEQVSQENIELVEKGKEATENLKIALHQLTEEKKAIQRKSSSGKDIRDIEASLERAKKERQAFRQRCEKSEMQQRNLQEEISSLKNALEAKEKELLTRQTSVHKETVDGGERPLLRQKSTSDEVDDSRNVRDLESAHSRISQLKKYVHILEDRIKEKDEIILSLRKENARANDVVMEKSLELSKSRRILERKIEKLTNENSELRRRLLNSGSYSRLNRMTEEAVMKQQEDNKKQREKRGELVEGRQRRRSNPERSAIETTLKRLNNVENTSDNNDALTGKTLTASGNQTVDPHKQDSGKLKVPLDVTPRRRIGGKFIRASSKRHSADLGKLMYRPEAVINRKSDSDMLHEDEPATIFINKYRKKSEEEEHWV